jgi:hypothetical protein
MSKAEKPRLLRWMYRIDYPLGPIEFRDLLGRGAETVLGKSAADAAAYAEANLSGIWNYLLRAQNLDHQRGLHQIFRVEDGVAKRLRWCPSPDSATSKNSREVLRLRSRHLILAAIDQLNDRQFEALGCVASSVAGANQTLLTPHGNDKGVDFYATIVNPTRSHIFSGSLHPFRIVGQSKKYSSAVGVDKVNQLAKTLDYIRHASIKIIGTVPTWFRSADGPIVGWIIGDSGFQSGARDTARDHGILLSDSLDIAELFAMSRSSSDVLPATARAAEFVDRIISTLKAFSTSSV